MKFSESLKPGLVGAAIGAGALAIIGFSAAGWVTGETADRMANERAEEQVVSALVPICVSQSSEGIQASQTMAKFRDANSYQRRDILIDAGWATMPGSDDPNEKIARACAEALAAKL